jgi:quinoprotein glucose dehydrogenase
MRLIAVDAATGRPCADFGQNGQANLQVGLGQKDSINAKPAPMIPGTASITATPVIVQGVIVTGQEVWTASAAGLPRASSAVMTPSPGSCAGRGTSTIPSVTKDPPAGGYYSFGTPNSWTGPVGDEKLGLAYIPMGNSAGDYYTSLRSDAEKKVNSAIVALDVKTGKPRWVFQTVHNDVWDYDIGSQPSLVEFPVGGRRVPALLVPSKQGEIYVLDRATGRSLQRVEERPVPQGGAEPAAAVADAALFDLPHAGPGGPDREDMWGLSPIDQMMCRIQFRRARYEGRYTPPELNRHNIEWPGYNGGSDWGSVAIDPRRGVIIANYNDTANSDMLVSRQKADQLGLFRPAIREGRTAPRAPRARARWKARLCDPGQRRLGDADRRSVHAAAIWWDSRDRSRQRQDDLGSAARNGARWPAGFMKTPQSDAPPTHCDR